MAKDAKKENVLSAIVIVESFNLNIESIPQKWAFSRLGSATLLDYTLESLARSVVQRVFLCVNSCDDATVFKNNYAKRYSAAFSNGVEVIVSEGSRSVGDVIRDLDNRGITNSDFVLLRNGCLFTDSLSMAVDEFKNRRKKDKNAILTMIVNDFGDFESDWQAQSMHALWSSFGQFEATYIGYNKNGGKLHYYRPSTVEIKDHALPRAMIKAANETRLTRYLVNSGIAICSAQAAAQFSDNFDFSNLNDLVAEILVNEDVLGQSVHLHILNQSKLAINIQSLRGLFAAEHMIRRRFLMPLHPTSMIVDPVPSEHSPVSKLNGSSNTSIFGRVCSYSSIGYKCHIDAGAMIECSIIEDDVQIGSNSTVVCSYIMKGARIGRNVCIAPNCVVGSKVTLPDNFKMSANTILVASKPKHNDDETEFGNESNVVNYIQKLPGVYQVIVKVPVAASPSVASVVNKPKSKVKDDDDLKEVEEIFANEVFETLQRGFEEKLTGKNMILEINGSRFAYNITGEDLTQTVISAILKVITTKCNGAVDLNSLKQILVCMSPVLTTYCENAYDQAVTLEKIETESTKNDHLLSVAVHILHVLYENDVLSEESILKWHNDITADESDDDDEDTENEKEYKRKLALLANKVQPFVDWLRQAEEESDDD